MLETNDGFVTAATGRNPNDDGAPAPIFLVCEGSAKAWFLSDRSDIGPDIS